MFRCSIGTRRKADCSARPFTLRRSLEPRHAELLDKRAGCYVRQVCGSHFKTYITCYAMTQKNCCDPFAMHASNVSKSLKSVSSQLHDQCRSELPAVVEGKKLCITCMKEVVKRLQRPPQRTTSSPATPRTPAATSRPSLPIGEKGAAVASPAAPGFIVTDAAACAPNLDFPGAPPSITSESSEASSGERMSSPAEVVFERLNKGLGVLGVSPAVRKNLESSQSYRERKFNTVSTLLKDTLNKAAGKASEISTSYEKAGKEMVDQLRHKFINAKTYAEKVHVLSVLPASWSSAQIKNEFGATLHMIKVTKKLVGEQGILCCPNPKKGRALPVETENAVRNFYEHPDISRETAGKKECISVKNKDNTKTVEQKRLVLGDLREIYLIFKQKHPEIKIGFSTFASLRPRHCVLAGTAGTHTVCVCMVHQNFKLMYMGACIGNLRVEEEKRFEHYRQFVTETMCEDSHEDCHFGRCRDCPGTAKLQEELEELFAENFISEVTYKKWIKDEKTGRFSLGTMHQTTEDFLERFLGAIPELRQHDYITKQQAQHFEEVKNGLSDNEVVVVADFSENLSFVIQDSIQGAYWNNQQATIHPFACYWRNPENKLVEPLNLVVISDHLKHNTTTVSKFQEVLVDYLKTKVHNLKKIFYFSDGCTGQYKNRFNMMNLLKHYEDYGVLAEWHFYATSHGKGPSDGLGGTLKRKATKASLQRPYKDQIQTPEDLYNWAKTAFNKLTCAYVSSQEIEQHAKKINKRFLTAPCLEGIRSHHCFLPRSEVALEMKLLSSSASGRLLPLLETTPTAEVNEEDDELLAGVATRTRLHSQPAKRKSTEVSPALAARTRSQRRKQ